MPVQSGDSRAGGEGESLNLKAFLTAVRRYWLTFVLATVAVFVVGLTWILLSATQFVSSTQLMVTISGSTTATAYQNEDVVEGRINSYIPLMTSGVVAQRVIDKLGLPLTTSEVAARINATRVPPKTSIIDVTVTDDSPGRAQLIADTLASEFVSYAEALETPTGEDSQKVHTTVISTATEARGNYAERILLGVLTAFAALLFGAIAVWIRARTDPIVRTADQAAAAAGVPVLGYLPPASTSSRDDFGISRRVSALLRSMTQWTGRARDELGISRRVSALLRSMTQWTGRAKELYGSRRIVADPRVSGTENTDDEPRVATADTTDDEPRVAEPAATSNELRIAATKTASDLPFAPAAPRNGATLVDANGDANGIEVDQARDTKTEPDDGPRP